MVFRAGSLRVAAMLALVCAAGCRRQAQTPVPAGEQSAASPEATTAGVAPLPATPIVVAAPEDGNVDAVLGQLSRELRRYVLVSRNAPKNFEDFADKAHLQAPPPPAGQKYAIQNGAIVLVKR